MLTTDENGLLYLMQSDHAMVKVYSPDGALLREIGGRGGGPGEFERPARLGWLGNMLWIDDFAQRRITLFDAQGQYVRSVTIDEPCGDSRCSPIALLADGSVLGQSQALSTALSQRVPYVEPLHRYSEDGHWLHPYAMAVRRNELAAIPIDNGVSYISQTFTDTDLVSVHPLGLDVVIVSREASVSSNHSMFEITRISFTDDTIFRRSYHYSPRPMPDSLRRKELDERSRAAEGMLGGERSGAMRATIRERLFLPDFLPPVTRVVRGRDGTIWIRREMDGRESVEWYALDGTGLFVGRASLPQAMRVLYGDLQNLIGYEVDQVGVIRVVRHRISQPEEQ